MKEARRDMLLAAATPMLQEHEEVQLTTFARVGSVSAKRKIATAATAAVLSAGILMVAVHPREMYLVLTDRRILFFDGHTATGRPGKHLMTVQRDLLTVSSAKGKGLGLAIEVELAVEGQDKNLKILFPTPSKEEGRQFISALPAAS